MALETTGLQSDYASWHMKDTGPAQDPPSIAQALAAANVGGTTATASGVDVDSANTAGIAKALAAVDGADAVVLVLGLTHAQEHEGMDRADTMLPGLQGSFAAQVLAAAKAKKTPVVLVLCSGGVLSIDSLVVRAGHLVGDPVAPRVRDAVEQSECG